MRICLLTNQDLLADPFPSDDWPCDPRPFYRDAHWEVECLKPATSVEQVTRRVRQRFDLFFNLCDGAADQGTPGIEVVKTLEEHGVAFTGATSEFYEPSREAMKRACKAEGIATPDYVLARSAADVERAAELLRFPLFVKHYSSYSSVDLSRRSRVCSPAGLRQQARKIMRRHGAALIEEFIEGTECTVLVAENPDDPARPKTYTPIQYRFPEGETFKHSDMKWVDFKKMSALTVDDAMLDAAIDAGADDVLSSESGHEIYASQETFREVAKALEAKFGEARKAALTWKPQNTVPVDDETGEKLLKLIDLLNEHDDVQNVYANFEVSDALVAKMGG